MPKTETKICDTCKEPVEVVDDRFDEHNKQNYVKHVFISHPENPARIAILQNYINQFCP